MTAAASDIRVGHVYVIGPASPAKGARVRVYAFTDWSGYGRGAAVVGYVHDDGTRSVYRFLVALGDLLPCPKRS